MLLLLLMSLLLLLLHWFLFLIRNIHVGRRWGLWMKCLVLVKLMRRLVQKGSQNSYAKANGEKVPIDDKIQVDFVLSLLTIFESAPFFVKELMKYQFISKDSITTLNQSFCGLHLFTFWAI